MRQALAVFPGDGGVAVIESEPSSDGIAEWLAGLGKVVAVKEDARAQRNDRASGDRRTASAHASAAAWLARLLTAQCRPVVRLPLAVGVQDTRTTQVRIPPGDAWLGKECSEFIGGHDSSFCPHPEPQ